MEIIVKLLPERANCPAGSTAVNFCLFFLQKRLQRLNASCSATPIGYQRQKRRSTVYAWMGSSVGL